MLSRFLRSWRRFMADIERQRQLDELQNARIRRMMEIRYQRRGY